ncbi:DUF3581 domain-containing protein [Methylonatrum kenyense]|uniref:DUF3581 family protein n=1 Tax=Methylonatrum kenyense TaxID=455253 RepID=UPI0020C0B1AE|nr:DUF3581 family protein [Methylonatrum kenyense]MCK8517131.1 DUF3581 domain-containing protein [Methylonatrum kenyense]
MFLDRYHNITDDLVRISERQGSRFAKEIAGDFNPIHDPGARRYCVPGDLLFALILGHYGLYPRMTFYFRGMVTGDLPLRLSADDGNQLQVSDAEGRTYLDVEREGEGIRDAAVTEAFVRRYSAFSGRNFPEFLEPLMREQGVMFNPDRPLVIYDSMAFELTGPVADDVSMDLTEATLDVNGRRGEEHLRFTVHSGGQTVGHGTKRVLLSGLQPLDQARLQAFVDDYLERRRTFS